MYVVTAMKLALSTWPDGSRKKEYSETDESLGLTKDLYRFPDAIMVKLTVNKANSEVIVEGKVTTAAYAECVRCLSEFSTHVDESFRRVASIVPDSQVTEDTGDPDFALLPESLPDWDLAEPVREIMLLSLPDNPLCREDCKGLCSVCGADLNRESCNCNRATSRNSMAQLGELLDQRREHD